MAITSAQLGSAITASQLQFPLTNIVGAGLPAAGAVAPLSVGVAMIIDSEIMFVMSQPVAGTVVVRGRGSEGTAAMTHDVLSNVYLSPLASDFGQIPAGTSVQIDPTDDVVVSIGQDGAISLPTSNTSYNINKATAAALTLAAPSLVENGLTALFTSQTAAAHVITSTGLIMDGTAAAPKSAATFTAGKGASVLFVAENGFWNVVSQTGVTFA